MTTSLRIAVPLAFLAAGCASTYPHDQLVTQAVYDLRCPAEQLTLTDLGGRVIPFGNMRMVQGVSGCGRRASYVYAPGSSGWLKNGAETAESPGAPQPAPPAPPAATLAPPPPAPAPH